jgi:hypothetical protein
LVEGLISKTAAKTCGYASIRGVELQRGSQSFDRSLLDPILQPFRTVACKNGEIVRLLRSETLHFMNRRSCSMPLSLADSKPDFVNLFSPDSA